MSHFGPKCPPTTSCDRFQGGGLSPASRRESSSHPVQTRLKVSLTGLSQPILLIVPFFWSRWSKSISVKTVLPKSSQAALGQEDGTNSPVRSVGDCADL